MDDIKGEINLLTVSSGGVFMVGIVGKIFILSEVFQNAGKCISMSAKAMDVSENSIYTFIQKQKRKEILTLKLQEKMIRVNSRKYPSDEGFLLRRDSP